MTSRIDQADGSAPAKSEPAGPRVAYIVSRFPHLPETFILREIDRLEADGAQVVLCPLLRQQDDVVHPAAQPWVRRAVYTPFISPTLLRDLLRVIVRDPRSAFDALLAPLARVARTPNFFAGTLGITAKVAHLARVVEERGIEHIHAHFATHPAMAAYMLHRLTGVSYSFTVHAHDLYVHTTMLERKLRDAAFVVTISDYNRALLRRYDTSTPVHVIRSGVALDGEPVQQYPPEGVFTLQAVGSLQPYKGFAYLVAAMGLLRDAGVGPVRLRIAGGGPEREALERQIALLDLRDHVELLGPQPEEEVARLLQSAHAFVLPSVVTATGKMEGLPVVLIEALAAGLPTIATDISGIPELIRDGETGRLVPPGDPDALAEAIRWVLEHGEQARTWAQSGRRLVEREHDLAINVRRLAALFREETAR
jgi:colanic acid/amylovoran biosynthesis glycosyltransferase